MSFETFISQLSKTNSTLESFVDFRKVSDNVDEISIHLNQLNYLIGKNDLENAVTNLYAKNKDCFKVLKILVAVRDNKFILSEESCISRIDDYFTSKERIIKYIKDTGLESVFKDKKIGNLVDYVFGIEVGLDSNARKNRGGKSMEKFIETIFTKNKIGFEREVQSTEFDELINLGKDIKRFDFVVKTLSKTYLIEVNYYNGPGSKLNETARSYSEICPKINCHKNLEFVWITDGQGWNSAKNKLNEAYQIIPKIYNLTSLTDFINILRKELNS